MTEVLRFFKNNEVFIYLGLGILTIWQLRRFILAWDELRSAAFGLEQENARTRLNWATSMLVLLLLLGVAEFGLVSFVIPAVPGATPLLTPTLDILATPTITIESPQEAEQAVNATPAATVSNDESSCIPGFVDITSPEENETIQDVVEIVGTADIPNFGFYKFEMSPANSTSWQTIQAGEKTVQEDILGFWDTTRLSPGDYALRLVVTDNQGETTDPCLIQVRVEAPTE